MGSTFDDAFPKFKAKFEELTGWTWEERRMATGVWPPYLAGRKGDEKPYMYPPAIIQSYSGSR